MVRPRVFAIWAITALLWPVEAQAQGFTSFAAAEATVRRIETLPAAGAQLQPWDGVVSEGSYGIRPAQPRSMTLSSSANVPGGEFDGCTMSASALSDLSTGTLKAESHVVRTKTDPTQRCAGRSLVGFGDTFRTYDSDGLFSWANGDKAVFNMLMTGSMSSLGPLSYFPPDTWQLSLFVYGVGESVVDPAGIWYANGSGVRHSWYLDSARAISISQSGSLETGGINLRFEFNPFGDFNWFLLLNTAPTGLAAPGYIHVDLSHTLDVSYQGPPGTYVQSASGVFPGTRATVVPEPSGKVLILIGLVGMVAIRRKRNPQPS